MRYAIISDIHGNLEALKTVIEDIKKQNIDRIICLGDIISKGCHNHECLEIVRQISDAVVKGNNDVKFTKSLDEIAGVGDLDYDHFYWTQKQLTADDINYIRHLPMCCEFVLSGRKIRCFHATPSDINESVFNFTNYEKKLSLFEPSVYTTNTIADVIVYGHTHFTSYEKLYGKTLINVGSVGNSLNIISDEKYNSKNIGKFTMAEYLILSGEDNDSIGEISIEIRNIPYDKDKELACFNYEKDRNLYTKEILKGEYRHPERIHKQIMTKQDKSTNLTK